MDSNPVLEITSQVESYLHSITDIWDDIGFNNSEREKRKERIVELVLERLEEIRKEEKNTLKKLHKSIEQNGEETVKLCRELDLEVETPPENISTLQLEQQLRYKVNNLRKIIADRRKKMVDLQRAEQELCERLQEDPSSGQKPIPSLEDLMYLESRINTLEQEKVHRENEFKQLKNKIIKLMEDLEHPPQPNTSLESNLFCDEELVTLSSHNINLLKNYHCDLQKKLKANEEEAGQLLQKIRQLWTRLNTDDQERNDFETSVHGFAPSTIVKLRQEMERLEDLKMQNMARFINQLRRELEQCWQDTFTGDEERNLFTYYFTDTYNEEVLDAHDTEVQRLRDYYSENEHIFKKIKLHQELWERLNNLEERANDPDRLFGNRGGTLLEEEKERKVLQKKLPKVQKDLQDELLAWEGIHKKPFLVMGQPLEEFITSQWEHRNEVKLQEKIERREAKQRQLNQESRLGSRPVSAAKRRIMRVKNDTMHASKLRRIVENEKQPSHGSTLSTTNSTRSSKSSMISTPSKTMSVAPGRLPLRDQNAGKTRSHNTTVIKKDTFGEISTYSQFSSAVCVSSSVMSSTRFYNEYEPLKLNKPFDLKLNRLK